MPAASVMNRRMKKRNCGELYERGVLRDSNFAGSIRWEITSSTFIVLRQSCLSSWMDFNTDCPGNAGTMWSVKNSWRQRRRGIALLEPSMADKSRSRPFGNLECLASEDRLRGGNAEDAEPPFSSTESQRTASISTEADLNMPPLPGPLPQLRWRRGGKNFRQHASR
jgi:hypothetical protein